MIGTKLGTNIRRTGLIGLLSTAAILGLAACGDATPASRSTSTATSTAAVAATETIPAEVATEVVEIPQDLTPPVPDALATATTATSDIPGPDGSPTATAVSASPAATPTAPASESEGEVVEIQTTLREWGLDLSRNEVSAGKVRFIVTNSGQFAHNLTVGDNSSISGQTPTFAASEGPQILEVDLTPNEYNVLCSLPGHANRGQQAQLVVK